MEGINFELAYLNADVVFSSTTLAAHFRKC